MTASRSAAESCSELRAQSYRVSVGVSLLAIFRGASIAKKAAEMRPFMIAVEQQASRMNGCGIPRSVHFHNHFLTTSKFPSTTCCASGPRWS